MASVSEKFHTAIAIFIYHGGPFEVDNENESKTKCCGKSLKPRNGEFANLNEFSRSVLKRFEDDLRSIKQ
jgi:hypothetical protein